MKFTYAIAALVATAASVQASSETNAQRLSRGLNPLPPRALHHHPTRVNQAKRATPSNTSGGSCNTGPMQCCNQVTQANDSVISAILGLLDLVVDPTAMVGLQCSPLSGVGVGGGNCKSRPVCCENNSQGGLVSIGCIPIML